MNKDLVNDFYKLPDELLSVLTTNLSNSNEKQNGYDRLNGLFEKKGVNYGQAKKIKHEMENDMDPKVYKLIGGDELLDWVNSKLEHRRKSIESGKRQRMNAGMPNQFKKEHTKDNSKNATKVRLVKAPNDSRSIYSDKPIYEEIKRIKQIITELK